MGRGDEGSEWLRCKLSVAYFVHNYCYIYDATLGAWIPFHLWPDQFSTLKALQENRLVIILKARQLGMTWLVLAYVLWLMTFHPIKTAMLFSRRDDEAKYLLGKERLRGMYKRLPDWMQAKSTPVSSEHAWQLSNDSIAYAFPTTAGDSYTASLVIADEADLIPDLNKLINAAKPTIDGGGSMILLSRSDKENPNSEFKQIYRSARSGDGPWKAVFLPWWSRPSRTPEWYAQQRVECLTRTGSLDDLYMQYPASDEEALAPRSMDKRIPFEWLRARYVESKPIKILDSVIPRLALFEEPDADKIYVVGADPAEGNPTSDDSSFTVMEEKSKREVACLHARVEPIVFATYLDALRKIFGPRTSALIERNNHGHAVIAWLKDNSNLELLKGLDGDYGWHTNAKSKAAMYTEVTEGLRDGEGTVRSEKTFTQLASIEGSTLKAPKGSLDDAATSWCLAFLGCGIDKGNAAFAYQYTETAEDALYGRYRTRQHTSVIP